MDNNNSDREVPVQSMTNGVYNNSSGRIHVTQDNSFQCETPAQWRQTQWSGEYLDQLKGEVMRFTPNEDKNVTKTRILMIGPVGSGKSSFYNTIASIYRGRITQHAPCGSGKESLTTNYTTYIVKNQGSTELSFCLCDTRGMEELNSLHLDDCKYLLDGNIKTHYKFTPRCKISRWDQCFNNSPSADDRVHCIMFVFDSTTLDVLSEKLLDNVKIFQDLAKERDIPQTVILTKIDKLCEEVKRDTSFACTSQAVEKCIDKAADLLGLPRNTVFPLKNYENETELDNKMSILALVALRQMLIFSEDASKARLEKARIEAERAEWRIMRLLRDQCKIH